MLLAFAPRGLIRPTTFGLAIVVLLSVASAEPLAYRWNDGQKFSYQMEIVVDSNSETITYKGVIHYTVNKAGTDQASLTYSGGLSESKKSKRRNVGRFPFGPRGFGGPPSSFARPAFAGKTQTTNKIALSSRGETLTMQGDSQLPYLLGNVSLMPFEPLPEGDKKQWTYDSGVSITERDEQDRRPFGPFGPRGPFGPFGNDENKNVQAAGEGAGYTIKSDDGKMVVVAKTYRLNTPKTEGEDSFEMLGEGTWTFDRQENVPHAYDMKFSLNVRSGNTSTLIPITVKYTRISPEKLAEMEAAAKQKAEELARAAAEKKAMAEAPLSAEEKAGALAALASTDTATIKASLDHLATKSLKEPDPEIAAAIQPHLTSSDSGVAGSAHKAMTKWSPAYAQRKALEKAYQGPAPVSSTGLVVESITPLYVGQLVQAQRPRRGPFWRAARVKKLLSDGQVELAFLTWGKENSRDIVAVPRRNIQLAPPELEQPAKPASTAPAKDQPRTWSDATGRFKIEATLVDVIDGKVNLRRADGRTLAPIPIEKLSEADQAFIKQWQASEDENPFKLN